MSQNETRRSLLQKSASAAILGAGTAAFSGSAAGTSDSEYRVVIEADGSSEGDYAFKVPWGETFESGVSEVSSIEGDDVDFTRDAEDRETIVSGTVEANDVERWKTTSSGEPVPIEEFDCTISVFEKI